MTKLIKKDSFEWGLATIKAFEALKQAMTQASLLALPDFSCDFVIEADTSEQGIRVVLMQLLKLCLITVESC